MDHAFNLAHEANPSAHLIYNDYNMDDSKKRQFVVEMIRDFKKKGVPIHGIGMQAHYHLNEPDIMSLKTA